MNVSYPKTISISLLKFALPLLVLLFLQIAANAQSYTQTEQNCFDMVQNKVAYDQAGSKAWNEVNIRKLCKGTTNPTATISCFTNVINNYNDWNRGINECSAPQNKVVRSGEETYDIATYTPLRGNWDSYFSDGRKSNNIWAITQSAAGLSFQGLGETKTNFTAKISGSNITGSNGTVGLLSEARNQINWSDGTIWLKRGSTLKLDLPSPSPQTSGDSGMITRFITIKNNSAISIIGALINRTSYEDSRNKDGIKSYITSTGEINAGYTRTVGESNRFPVNEDLELVFIRKSSGTLFKAALPKNKNLTTFCYEVTGTYFVPYFKECDGGATYESSYILFKNEAGFVSNMSLTYYALGSSTTKTFTTESTSAGYQRKLYLPLDADTNKPMTLKVLQNGVSEPLFSKDVVKFDFDSVGSVCYKAWGSFATPKVSQCSLNPNARTIKLWNNAGYPASLKVTYYDKVAGKDVEKIVNTNTIELTQTETIEVPNGTSLTPVKIEFLNKWNGNKTFSTMNASANFTGELCYKVEGTTFAPTAATCDDTVGDTTGETRQIRFQNDAGYDAQMMVSFFVDEIINGNKIPMMRTLTTGMINGLGGKFRLVTIPKNTSKGMPITISLQGNATVKNNVWSATLEADFAASPQPCFKVWGTALNPDGGKCNQ